MPGHAIWALVADGTRARLLRDLSARTRGPTELILRSRAPHLNAALRGSASVVARPGDDPIEADMRLFAICLSDCANAHRLAGDFDTLAVLATRRMHAMLEEEMAPRMRAATIWLAERNLVRCPSEALRGLIRCRLGGLALPGTEP